MKRFGLLVAGLMFVLSVTAWAGIPEGVSPASDGVAVVSSTCPTFSWSEVDGADGYTIEVYEVAGSGISHDEVAAASEPVITRDVGRALSWTPSGSECLKDGTGYVWFVGVRGNGRGAIGYGQEAMGDGQEATEWSEGRVFEVSLLSDAETVEAARELVNSYLQTDWLKTESFTAVKEEIRREIAGGGSITAAGQIGIMGSEGDTNGNTYYGTGAGSSLVTTNCTTNNCAFYNSIFGYFAGFGTTSGDYNTFLGEVAGYNNTTGDYNTFVGSTAGYKNSMGDSNTFLGNAAGYYAIASQNTFLGFNAGHGQDNSGNYSPGTGNTFIGFETGKDFITADYSTYVGYRAGTCVETADENTFIGYGAGSGYDWNNGTCRSPRPTGNWNTFVGYQAGNNFTSAISNTFVGYQAGYSNTEGNWNTFMGLQAGYFNTIGKHNTFVGLLAGYGENSGTDGIIGVQNTFLGDYAGRKINSGSNNIFLGYSAGYNNADGSGNVFIGLEAGYNATGSGNVFVGTQAGYNETGSNKLYIDNSGTSAPLIYGDFTDGSEMVRINGTLDTAGNMITVNKADTSAGTGPGTKAPGMSWAGTGRLNIGWGGKGGGNLIAYSKGHATRPGEFFFVFGGGPSIGKVKFAHYDGSKSRIKLSVLANGNVGFGVNEPVYPIEHASGAHLTAGGVWVNASSREYKEGITPLTEREAMEALEGLKPVRYRYKADPGEDYVGFIAEDVPELLATKDRKSLSSMDIVAVLTKVVQRQTADNRRQTEMIKKLEDKIKRLEAENRELRVELKERIATLERQLKLMNTVAER